MSNNHSVSVLSVCLVVLFLICYGMKPVYSRSVNCASKRWHSSIGCQELTELKVIRKEVYSREKCKIIYLFHIFTGQLKVMSEKVLRKIQLSIPCFHKKYHNVSNVDYPQLHIYMQGHIENLSRLICIVKYPRVLRNMMLIF